MSLSDLLKLMRHYLKVVAVALASCVVLTVLVVLVLPPTYEAKSTLLTDGDIALAGGFAQSEAEAYSQNGITVSSQTDTNLRTITIVAEGADYGGVIAAVNATVLAAADDVRDTNNLVSVSTNEATYAENVSPSIPKMALIALLVGFFIAICIVVVIDAVKAPIRSKNDIKDLFDLPIIGEIPNRDRGERLLANVRFLSDEPPSTIAVVPTGLVGSTLTCAELAGAFEHSGAAVRRIKGNPHAEGFNDVPLPGVISIVECSSISEGMGAIYIAKEADITILCVREWLDSRKALTNLVEELMLAQCNIAGVVFLSTK